MTVQSTDRKAGPFFSGTILPFDFKVFSKEDIQVIWTSAAGVESILVLDSEYSVTLNPDQDNTPGGSVTLSTAITGGANAVIIGDLVYDQGTDIRNQSGFEPEIVEDALDRVTILVQQLLEMAKRTLRIPASSSSTISTQLPQPTAGNVLGWNGEANQLVNLSPQDIATTVAFGTAFVDQFEGDTVETEFSLSANPALLANMDVQVDGVSLRNGIDFVLLAGAVIKFTTPPAAPAIPGSPNIQVRGTVAVPQGFDTADVVVTQLPESGLWTTVQGFINRIVSGIGASIVGYLPAGTGAVATTVENKLRESASVTNYGASPSASATENKAAFVAATTEAKRVLVPTGDYISESFDMPANTILYGEGTESSRLFFTTGNAATNDCINMGQNCELRDLYMSPQTKTASYSVLPLLVPEAVFDYNPNIDAPRLNLNCKAIGCFFDGFNNGIASDSNNVTVEKCVSKGGNSALVFFDSDGFSITASVFYGGIFGGVALPSCKNGVVIGNRLIMPGSTGVNPGGSSAAGFNVENLTISDNVIIATNGVTCELGIEGVTISNNVILMANPVTTDGVGIGVATRNGGGKLSNIVITGNTIRPLNPAQSYAFGINVANDDPAGPNLSLDNVTITGNSIVGASSGIIVQALISFVVGATVSSNKITGGRFGLYFIACRRVTAIGNVMEADGPGTLSNYYGILFGSCTDSIFAENIIKGYGVHFYQTGDDTSNVRLLCNTSLPNDDAGAFVELQNTSAIAPDSMLRYSEAIPAAFGVFDGSGAVGAITPLQQKGVLSISKIATGRYRVTIERAFILSTPIVLPSAGNTTGVTGAAAAVENISASSFDILVFLTTTGAPSDLDRVGFTVIGS